MKNLIVNADDFGRSAEITSGIVAAFLHGIVTSASLMVTFPAFEMAADCVVKHRLHVGIHLNLTDGRPLSDPQAVPSLVDQSGRFYAKNHFFLRLLQNLISLSEARRELEAQVQRALLRGLRLDHLNGHHHIHAVPKLAPLCCDLARSVGIKFVRSIARPDFFSPATAAFQQWVVFAASSKALRPNLRHPDHFWGFELMQRADKEAALLKIVDRLRPGINELMCHPGELSSENIGGYNAARVVELEALGSEAVKAKLKKNNINLITFQEVE